MYKECKDLHNSFVKIVMKAGFILFALGILYINLVFPNLSLTGDVDG